VKQQNLDVNIKAKQEAAASVTAIEVLQKENQKEKQKNKQLKIKNVELFDCATTLTVNNKRLRKAVHHEREGKLRVETKLDESETIRAKLVFHATDDVGQLIESHANAEDYLYQRDPNAVLPIGPLPVDQEQPLATSMPSRFIALGDVVAGTNGKTHKVAHSLIKATLAQIGENLIKLSRAHGLSRPAKLLAIANIIGEQTVGQDGNQMGSNVWITNMLCGQIKRIHDLVHATHITLGQMRIYANNANLWFSGQTDSAEYQLVAANDLNELLGIIPQVRLVSRMSRRTIQMYFQKIG
jgi:hypothetical protein